MDMSCFLMRIDYQIVDGPRGGLTFDFIPCMHAFNGQYDHDRHGPDVFNVREEAFLFIEGMVAHAFPDWHKGYHWGIAWLPREIWLEILALFPDLRCDVRRTARLDTIVERYVITPGLLPRRHKLHRKALLGFLDQFEGRVRSILDHYPYLLISGI